MEEVTTVLINDLQQRKPAACQRLLTEYGPAVFRMVQRIVVCREDAEEVYQDVFVKALRGIGGYDSRQASLSTWLNRIAYHESLNFVRGPETSGTAFFTYGILWGVNNGYLQKKEFAPVIAKAWKYLTETALQKSGKVGYVQPIGERAIPGQTVNQNSEANFGVGAFLLAACEYVRYISR